MGVLTSDTFLATTFRSYYEPRRQSACLDIHAMWKLIIIDDQHQRTVVNLVRDEYSVGRAAGHAIRLTEQNISRNHAKLKRTANGFRVEDTSSYNGVFVNGVRLVGRQELGHNDLIQVGDYRIQVIDEAIDTQEQGYRPYDGATEPPISGRLPHRLVELIGPRQGQEYPLGGERLLVGRGEECEIVLEHGSVSRIHAEVRKIADDRYEILDKGSANGLRINGHELSRALLDGRDVIEIGDVVLKYIPQGQVFRATADEGVRIAAFAGAGPPVVESPAKAATGSVIAAILGATLVGGALMYVVETRSSPPTTQVPKELSALKVLIQRGDVSAAAHKMETLGTLEKSLAEYEVLQEEWARIILDAKKGALDEGERRQLLDRIVQTPSLPPKLREAARAQLAATTEGAVDLSALDAAPDK